MADSTTSVTVDLRDTGMGGTGVTVTEDPIDPAGVADAEAAWAGGLTAREELLAGSSCSSVYDCS